jgi:hypothetical protein
MDPHEYFMYEMELTLIVVFSDKQLPTVALLYVKTCL